MFSVVLVFSMLGLGRILISDLVVANLLMYSLPDMILLYLAVPFFTPKVFLDEIVLYVNSYTIGFSLEPLIINCIPFL